MTQSGPLEHLFPFWGWIAISLVVLAGVVATLDKKDTEKRTEQLNHDAPIVLADLRSGRINDLKQFQEHCGPADRREDRPASGNVPAQTGLFYTHQNLVVLFIRRKYGTPAQEAARAYPYAYFDEPTFWQIAPQHLVSAEVAIRALGCTEAGK